MRRRRQCQCPDSGEDQGVVSGRPWRTRQGSPGCWSSGAPRRPVLPAVRGVRTPRATGSIRGAGAGAATDPAVPQVGRRAESTPESRIVRRQRRGDGGIEHFEWVAVGNLSAADGKLGSALDVKSGLLSWLCQRSSQEVPGSPKVSVLRRQYPKGSVDLAADGVGVSPA